MEDDHNQIVVGSGMASTHENWLTRKSHTALQAIVRSYNALPPSTALRLLIIIPIGLILLTTIVLTSMVIVGGPQSIISHLPQFITKDRTPSQVSNTPGSSNNPGSSSNGVSGGNGGSKGGGGSGNGGGSACNHTGVSGSNGNYSFDQLVVDVHGSIVDASNQGCTIRLLGVNEGWWTAGTTGDPVTAKISMDFLTQHLHYNVIRVAFNSRWWKDNPFDSTYNEQFRPALTSFIKMAEQHGLYVELDLDSQFVMPPCDSGHPQCSQASQGSQDWDDPTSPYYHDPTGQELSPYQPTALWALNDMAITFKNDPAILFNVWNEPANSETKMPVGGTGAPVRAPISEDTFFKDMQDRVSAVANVTQNHIIVVYTRALSDIMGSSHYPIFTQKNIMYDTHIYQKNFDSGNLTTSINYAHSHGQAFVIGEWGGAPGQPDPTTFLPLLRANNTNDTYFSGQDLFDGTRKNPTTLNAIGLAVDAQYQITFGQ